MCAKPVLSFTHQSQKRKIRDRVDRAGYEVIIFHIDTSPTIWGFYIPTLRIPEIMNWYALEDDDEDVSNGETDNKMVAPQQDAAELDDGEDAILEEYTTDLNSSDIMTSIAQ